MRERKLSVTIMPMSQGLQNPQYCYLGACSARRTDTSRPEYRKEQRQTTKSTQQHKHRQELPCLADASVLQKGQHNLSRPKRVRSLNGPLH